MSVKLYIGRHLAEGEEPDHSIEIEFLRGRISQLESQLEKTEKAKHSAFKHKAIKKIRCDIALTRRRLRTLGVDIVPENIEKNPQSPGPSPATPTPEPPVERESPVESLEPPENGDHSDAENIPPENSPEEKIYENGDHLKSPEPNGNNIPNGISEGLGDGGSGNHVEKIHVNGEVKIPPKKEINGHNDLQALDCVWAKCKGYPWYPALVMNPELCMGLEEPLVYGDEELPVPSQEVIDSGQRKNEESNEVHHLVLFFDSKRTW